MNKYLFVVPSLSNGGAERVVSILSNQLISKGNKVVIVKHYDTMSDYYVDPRVKVVSLSNLLENEYKDKINLLFLLKMIYKLRKAIIKENPDFIIPFLWTTCIRVDLALLFSKNKKNVIQTVRNNPQIFPKNYFLKIYRNYLVKKSIATIVQNNDQKNYFNKKFHNKIFILSNPVSDDIFNVKRNLSNDKFVIIGVGRLEEQKNFPLLIDSFALINKKFPNTYLNIYGDGSQFSFLSSLIKDKDLDNRVKLCGRCNNYNTIYGNANAFVLPSNFEGLPNTLIEAMAVGIPCISTDCPTGPHDIISNGVNGILIKINDVSDLSNALIKVISDKKFSMAIASNAKKYSIDNFSSNKIADDFINICLSLKKGDF